MPIENSADSTKVPSASPQPTVPSSLSNDQGHERIDPHNGFVSKNVSSAEVPVSSIKKNDQIASNELFTSNGKKRRKFEI